MSITWYDPWVAASSAARTANAARSPQVRAAIAWDQPGRYHAAGLGAMADVDLALLAPDGTVVAESRAATGGSEVRIEFSAIPGPGTDLSRFNSWLTQHQFEGIRDGLSWYSARLDTAEQGGVVGASGRWMTAYHESDPNFSGTDTAIDLYWGAQGAVWTSGKTLNLRDSSGDIQSTFNIP